MAGAAAARGRVGPDLVPTEKARQTAGLLRLRSPGSRLARVLEPGTPWDLAHGGPGRERGLRPLTALAQFDDALGIMVATWGAFQLPPRELMTALAHSGNVPFGAYEGDRLVGFVLGGRASMTAGSTSTRTCWRRCPNDATEGSATR